MAALLQASSVAAVLASAAVVFLRDNAREEERKATAGRSGVWRVVLAAEAAVGWLGLVLLVRRAWWYGCYGMYVWLAMAGAGSSSRARPGRVIRARDAQ